MTTLSENLQYIRAHCARGPVHHHKEIVHVLEHFHNKTVKLLFQRPIHSSQKILLRTGATLGILPTLLSKCAFIPLNHGLLFFYLASNVVGWNGGTLTQKSLFFEMKTVVSLWHPMRDCRLTGHYSITRFPLVVSDPPSSTETIILITFTP